MSVRDFWIIGATIAVGTIALASAWGLRARWIETRREIRRACTCGYLPGPPTDAAARAMRMAARCAVWIQIGPIEVIGAENFETEAPKVILATHGHYLDPFVLALLLPERARCMAALGLFRACGGLGALVFSRWGAFCTDLNPAKGGPALRAAVRVLASGQTLVLFPEGWAHMAGAVGPFKPGAAAIARLAAAKAGRPVSIVPVYLRYGAYPGPWIESLPPPLQYLLVLLGLAVFRRGARVVVGAPLLSSSLPKDNAAATERLRNEVLALASPPGSEDRVRPPATA